eukprot:4573985-Pyramimonas_sp.AAC.1
MPLGPSWAVGTRACEHLELFQKMKRVGPLWLSRRPRWSHLAPSWGPVGPSWAVLGHLEALLGACWGPLGLS